MIISCVVVGFIVSALLRKRVWINLVRDRFIMWWNRLIERRQNLNTLENPLYMRDLEEKMKATIALDRMTKRKQAREQVEGIYADTSFS